MDWFKLSLQLNKFPINRAQKTLQEIQEIPVEDYNNYISGKRQEIVEFHLNNNRFYKNFFRKNSFSNWNEVPVMAKTDLQQKLENRLSKGFSKSTAYIGKTSGSSGTPFIFAKDKFAHALSWAGFQDRYQWHDIDLNKSLQARFYGIPLDFYGNIQERIKDRISLRRRFPIFDLSEQKMEKFLKRFKNSNFSYINGYTSAVLLFAKFLDHKNLNLKEVCPHLKLCIVTSERLFKEDKKLMELVFGVPVVNEYGASEVGLIAFENKENEWVVNAEDLFVEILDKNNKPVPTGSEGRIVITSLYNKAHPIIRYDVGDTGVLSEKSTLKKPILEKLIGRTNDIAILPDGKVVPGLTFYYVTKSIIEDTGSIKEFVINQNAQDSFKIEYVSQSDFSETQKQKILQSIKTYVGKNLKVAFERKDKLARSKSGKLKQFTSTL
ncbi:phenylacetate--CoA ligase family protein [Salegentibacter salegens]|uniref:Phenylacetate-CoA ligase n=1 Tax=Salegentibacter salegens TaxID=143223 RepID=A0A1M7M9S8_9FLAO|nr:phenylacetate--CoA ligase family protein [Salegentibacter salegens]PRX51568.1 phenylacetate-CoA ligase [Salegentibacter salegens]SHM87475.1 phenylacetate-CoA ligase [Salegentibacter salegens]